MRRNWMIGSLIVVLSTLLAGPLRAQRRPHGVYAKINISAEIKSHNKKGTSSATETDLINLYNKMLQNGAVSGLALQEHWDDLNPNPPPSIIELHPPAPYDWTFLKDAVDAVTSWNTANPHSPKNIQLIITPGFQSPQWLLDELPSCDALFEEGQPAPPSNCGRVTFVGKPMGEEQDSDQLPLPWDTTYKNAYRVFLTALSAQFGSNPLIVSISVAGPTAASEEMVMPNNNNYLNPQVLTVGKSEFMVKPNDMWLALFAFHYTVLGVPETAYQSSDQAFIDEWDSAIDMYGQLFSGLTLVATTGSNLPNFPTTTTQMAPRVPIDFTDDCDKTPVSMDCAAETMILSYFVTASVGGSNAKATQTSGVEASRAGNLDLGLKGVRLISASTAILGTPQTQIMGGLQFDTSVAMKPEKEGGEPGSSGTPSVEQAFYNVLQAVFTDTAAGVFYCEPTNAKGLAPAPLNYLQIYSNDFQYADANPAKVPVNEGACRGGTIMVSAQEELVQANELIIIISEPELLAL